MPAFCEKVLTLLRHRRILVVEGKQMEIPKVYSNWAREMINTFWTRPLDKGRTPPLSKAQIRQQIAFGIAQMQELDGSPADWTHCEHCEGTGIYEETSVTDKQEERTVRGLCYQCYGKGRQSAADRKRNRNYKTIRQEREMSY